LFFGVVVAFGCSLAAGRFDVDVVAAVGAGDGSVVGVGVEDVAAVGGLAAAAAGYGGAGADEVALCGVDGGDECAFAFGVGADEFVDVVVELAGGG
jgi:hypothetical protein